MPRMPVRAAVLTAPGRPLRIDTLFLDEPGPGEVLVRTSAVGLCHSDLHYLRGSLEIATPAVLGHEIAGVVERVGDGVRRLRVGEQVVATVTPACGGCPRCVSGRQTLCERVGELRERDRPRLVDGGGDEVAALGAIGAFAEAVVVPEAALARVDDDVDAAIACLLGCCVSTGVGAVIHGSPVTPADTVAVIGCGGVGMAVVQGARISGARRIVAVDLHADKLALAEKLGATDVVQATSDDVRTSVLELVPGGVTHAFEAVGRAETAELAFSLLAPGGVATVLGLMPAGTRIAVEAAALVEGDRGVRGAYMGANRFLADIPSLIDHLRAGRLDLDTMVTAVVGLDGIDEAFEAMRSPSSIRTVVDFREGAGR